MRIYIFNPEPERVEVIPPQVSLQVPIVMVGEKKAVITRGEYRYIRTADEAGHIPLVWGYYYDTRRKKVFLDIGSAPDPLIAYILLKQEHSPLWANEWLSGRMNVSFRPSELGDVEKTRAKYARVAAKRRQLLKQISLRPSEVMKLLTTK